MKERGTVKILSDKGWQEVVHYHRWKVEMGPERTPIEFALHACPKDHFTLKVCEVASGCDTTARVLHPKTGEVIVLGQLRKGNRHYLPGAEVRKLARNAVHRLLKKVGHIPFMYAVSKQVVTSAALKAQQEAK